MNIEYLVYDPRQLGYKRQLAKNLAGVKEDEEEIQEPSDYFKRVFKIKDKEN